MSLTTGNQHGYSNSSPVSYVSESVSPIQQGSHDFVNGSSYSSYYGNQHYTGGFNSAVQQHSPSGSAAQQESLLSA